MKALTREMQTPRRGKAVSDESVKQILADRDYWRSFEHSGWKCNGFTGRDQATFVKDGPNGMSISCFVDWKVIELLTSKISEQEEL